MTVCVIGRGKVGRALQRGLTRAGIACALVRAHPLRFGSERARLFVLAVPDVRIRAVAGELAPQISRGSIALHCAGARDVDELAPLSARGVHVGVMHPLVSFASGSDGGALRAATFTVFGDRKAIAAAKQLARALGARVVTLPGAHSQARAAAYHASAALVANGAAALAFEGVQILRAVGFSQRPAERALAGLLASVAANVERVGVPRALTGPVVRGDRRTVERHLQALSGLDPQRAAAYAALQPLIVDAALAAGLAPEQGRAIARVAKRRDKQ